VVARIHLAQHVRSRGELFRGACVLRDLRVLIDAELIADDLRAEWSQALLLAGLLAEEGVKYWLYADDGAPPGTAEITIPETSVWEEPGRYPIGWLIAKPGDSSNSLASHEYCWTDGETINWGTLVGNRVEVAAADTQARAYSDLSSGEARSRRVADTVAAGAAQEVKADIFVTERPYLYAAHWLSGQGVAFCKPAEALQLISLYLRSRGIFLVARTSGGRYTFDKGLFYWVGARAILPSGWRWFSGSSNLSGVP
jgi:hypothetical protein